MLIPVDNRAAVTMNDIKLVFPAIEKEVLGVLWITTHYINVNDFIIGENFSEHFTESDDGTLADGLSTSLFIMGKEKAEKFWKKYSDKFDVILLTDDDQLYVSEGIADDFQSDYKVNIMKK